MDSAGTGYTYANDDPVNEVDPSGRFSFALHYYMLWGLVPLFPDGVTLFLTSSDPAVLASPEGLALIQTILEGIGNNFPGPIGPVIDYVSTVLTSNLAEAADLSASACGGGTVASDILVVNVFTNTPPPMHC